MTLHDWWLDFVTAAAAFAVSMLFILWRNAEASSRNWRKHSLHLERELARRKALAGPDIDDQTDDQDYTTDDD